MKTPIMDHRDLEKIMEELAAHARQYTPEWRYERAADDPGAATRLWTASTPSRKSYL